MLEFDRILSKVHRQSRRGEKNAHDLLGEKKMEEKLLRNERKKAPFSATYTESKQLWQAKGCVSIV